MKVSRITGPSVFFKDNTGKEHRLSRKTTTSAIFESSDDARDYAIGRCLQIISIHSKILEEAESNLKIAKDFS